MNRTARTGGKLGLLYHVLILHCLLVSPVQFFVRHLPFNSMWHLMAFGVPLLPVCPCCFRLLSLTGHCVGWQIWIGRCINYARCSLALVRLAMLVPVWMNTGCFACTSLTLIWLSVFSLSLSTSVSFSFSLFPAPCFLSIRSPPVSGHSHAHSSASQHCCI